MSDPDHMNAYHERNAAMRAAPAQKPPEPVGYPMGKVWLFHPKGCKVELAVPSLTAGEALRWIDNALDVGFLVQAPGLEEGENREFAVACVKGYKKDGTPRIDLYPDNNRYSFVVAYLEKPEEIAAFEFAAKVKIDRLPEYVGVGHLERGANAQSDRLFFQFPRPVGFVWMPNPKFKDAPAGEDTRSIAEKTKRRFVRWLDQAPTQPGARQENGKAETLTLEQREWRDHVNATSDADGFTAMIPLADKIANPDLKKWVKTLILEATRKRGYDYHPERKQFYVPEPAY